ncbi:MAG TPA: glycosyltransferase family 4 protein [Gemmatimonadaceae bacterium]|nr:glycosyltransferase family 4 protein [Gemmatimonadaceae bacterium]
MIRLGIFATHPIQYQAPIWRRLASGGVVSPTLHYFSDMSVRGAVDPGFGVPVQWDTPLLDGYESRFISRAGHVGAGLKLQRGQAEALLRTGRFDAVLLAGYAHRFEWQMLRAARRTRVPVVMRGEFSDVASRQATRLRRRLRDAVLRRLYRSVDAFCVIGSDARDHLERLGVPSEKLFFSPYSVDSDHFLRLASEASRARSRSRLGLRDDERVVLFSGKLIERKGVAELLDAIRRAHGRDPRVRLLMVGDGPLRPLVEQARDAMGAQAITLAGFVNQGGLGDYFSAADVFVLPSRHETWGLVVNEAMYFGLPVVTTDAVGAARDLVRDDAGAIVPSRDAERLASALERVLNDPEAARAMGRVGRARVAEYSTPASARGIELACRYVTEARR